MHALRRAALATMAVAMSLALPVGIAVSAPSTGGGPVAQAAPSTPVTTVSPKTGLKDGDTISVSGAGFSGAGAGIYVGLVQDDAFSSTNAGAWMTMEFIKAADIASGAWSTRVTVAATKGAFDCIENACSIYTVAAHGSSDRSQDTKVPVSFAAVTPTTTPAPTTSTPPPSTPPPSTTPPSTTTPKPTTTAPKPTTTVPTTTPPPTTATPPVTGSGPRVSVGKTSGLNAAGDKISVRGSGFSTTGMGIYVGIAQTNKYSSTNADMFYGTKYIKPTDMPGGSFSTTIDVIGAFPNGDCINNECALYTLAAHGSSDRSQDTKTKITFVGTAPPVTGGGGGGGGGGGTATGPGAAGAAPGTTFTANSGLSVSLSKSSDINPAGETVTVSGSGFSGAAPGLYVGLVQDNVFSAADASVWMTSAFVKPEQISGGNWSLSVDMVATRGAFDCIKNACSIYTVMAHGSSDRSQDTKTPVSFVGGVAPGTVTAPPALNAAGAPGAAKTAAVTLSKAKGLKVEGDEITISGTGFSGQQPGIYVGLIQESKFSTTDAGAWMTTAFITPSRIKDGAWSTSMKVQAVKGDSDCTKNACSIYTIAAHGSSDRSQDTQTPVSFGDDPDAPNADKAAAAALTADGGPTDGGTSAAANESNTSDSAIRNLADAISDGTAWIIPLLVGAVIGAGFAVATTVALRRRA
ncbi:hypothetical protein GS453_04905 [Rhodococcus hoagii]|uniref:Integral membrane protein n=2 Tax=Rhodococcus hoagii TaxID=43767 RepID=A0AAE5IQT8_RHOHA|nr:hypothetical protein C7H75_10390 [Prescottella equi]MBM4626217.1 hypothetical protein [Prescottella equi]ORL99549.1 hypothetical protein A5N73_16325 [Prescottella equi]ORM24395.1 hypothetical protein A5N68_17205 [Prescottella equi]BDC72122.1 hypothetical protein KAREA_20370 [Prescottella equi]